MTDHAVAYVDRATGAIGDVFESYCGLSAKEAAIQFVCDDRGDDVEDEETFCVVAVDTNGNVSFHDIVARVRPYFVAGCAPPHAPLSARDIERGKLIAEGDYEAAKAVKQ